MKRTERKCRDCLDMKPMSHFFMRTLEDSVNLDWGNMDKSCWVCKECQRPESHREVFLDCEHGDQGDIL
jgi:hypothetical protein